MKIPGLKHFKARRIIRTNVVGLCVLKEVLLPTRALGKKGKGQTGGEALITALTATRRSPSRMLLFLLLILFHIPLTIRNYFLTKTEDTLWSFTD